MSQLFFKKHFQDAIRANQKRTTARRWSRPMVQAGQRAFSPGLGWLGVESVELIELEDLSDADAEADGIATANELKQVLHELYPSHATDEKRWFRVRFHLQERQPKQTCPDTSPGLIATD